MEKESQKDDTSIFHYIKGHPWISLSFAGCIIIGMVLCLLFLPAEWSLVRKLAAGLIGGLFSGVIITATWAVGKWDGDPE